MIYKGMRKKILTERDALSREQLGEKSARITETVLNFPPVIQADTIFLYLNFRSEVKTRQIFNTLRSAGKRVCVPLTRMKEHRIDAVYIDDPETQLAPGLWNILEPTPEAAASATLPPEEIDLLLMPGTVFDLHGGRFGYGGGFYDRYVAPIPKAERIGLAFELQVVDRLELSPHDQLVDCIITEERIIPGRPSTDTADIARRNTDR
ncbi:5-formyltetrahydrofolate cyclo-ligase [Desulforhopalus vacuolatus]|uniref:5-formyltetrahydrofolate cyclo-ligase n=1 Tax=Desulforhopalus vacuolatus TaxID=40414 RepID=UPI0019660D84|nr:5-formyltetrahydrofolate cyclo-ligase [Desulforhopalus vacuolatus]MBM9521001.1 5-formyltetrahydrofolate cyclo-ligase [Desulforhopalus vacuolatus]